MRNLLTTISDSVTPASQHPRRLSRSVGERAAYGGNRGLQGWDGNSGVVARYLAATLLLFAALQKLFAESVAYDALLLALVGFEFSLAFWLTIGIAPKASWYATLFTFGGFGGYSLAQLSRGSASCECFGDLLIPPAWMLVLDVAVLVMIAVTRNSWSESRAPSARSALRGTLAVGLSAILLMLITQGWQRTADRELSSQIATGQTFPLLHDISTDVDLFAGAWDVIIFSYDCLKCVHYLDRFALSDYRSQSHPRTAFISITDHSESPSVVLPHLYFEGAYHGTIREVPRGTAIPLHVRLDDGIIVDVIRT